MEKHIKNWIAKGFALEIASIILSEDKGGDLDRETLIVEIESAALDNIKNTFLLGEIDPTLSQEQLDKAIDAAGIAQIRNTVSEMVESGLLEASFNEEGEVVYSTTAKGQAYADMIEDKFMSQEDFTKQFNEGKI